MAEGDRRAESPEIECYTGGRRTQKTTEEIDTMPRKFRLPMFVVAAAMFGLMALLATLQYNWLGQISDAERERMGANLTARATAFAQDFDRELTRAYILFQIDGGSDEASTAARLTARYDRWQATSRFPRMIGSVYLVSSGDAPAIQRFNTATRFIEPAEWPGNLRQLQAQLTPKTAVPPSGTLLIRATLPAILEEVPAIVVPTPVILFDHAEIKDAAGAPMPLGMSYTVLVLDRDYVVKQMLPEMAEHHFRGAGETVDYQVAVVRTAAKDVLYHSTASFTPAADARADVTADLFQVRPQEFATLAADVRRFSTVFAQRLPSPSAKSGAPARGSRGGAVVREAFVVPPAGGAPISGNAQVSIVMQQPGTMTAAQKTALTTGLASAAATRAASAPKWKLLVTHPSGSLEAAVQTVRRRNVLVSSGILAVLGASMLLLVISTRRAQRLAAQQMEFVAAVSHELRTPLAVIRSAGENLADGVVRDEEQIRRYGDLVRSEGRRLTEMVEQTLELAGIQSGQRGFSLAPVAIRPLLDDILDSSHTPIERAGLDVEIDVPDALPSVLGDATALRRAFQNLIANAIKYGERGKWIGLRAHAAGRDVVISVKDRGIGIAAAEHERIFEPFYRTPDVVAAQIHGAGLGLSLVKRIVETHGGRISVQSTPGEGSEFTVRLPAASQQPIADAAVDDGSHAAAHPTPLQS
jgi:two-component system, OmpR family, sensor histidine kinase SenX3